MNIPGFTAEVSLCDSVTLYYSNNFIKMKAGLNVTPQLSDNWPEVFCRRDCYRYSEDSNSLEECLANC
jgi:hypothetical protein